MAKCNRNHKKWALIRAYFRVTMVDRTCSPFDVERSKNAATLPGIEFRAWLPVGSIDCRMYRSLRFF